MLKKFHSLTVQVTSMALAAAAIAGTAHSQAPADVNLMVVNDCIT